MRHEKEDEQHCGMTTTFSYEQIGHITVDSSAYLYLDDARGRYEQQTTSNCNLCATTIQPLNWELTRVNEREEEK